MQQRGVGELGHVERFDRRVGDVDAVHARQRPVEVGQRFDRSDSCRIGEVERLGGEAGEGGILFPYPELFGLLVVIDDPARHVAAAGNTLFVGTHRGIGGNHFVLARQVIAQMIGYRYELIVRMQVGFGLFHAAAQHGQFVGTVARCGGRQFEHRILGGYVGDIGFGAVFISGHRLDLYLVAGLEARSGHCDGIALNFAQVGYCYTFDSGTRNGHLAGRGLLVDGQGDVRRTFGQGRHGTVVGDGRNRLVARLPCGFLVGGVLGVDRVGQFLGFADEQGQFGLRKFDLFDTDRGRGDGDDRLAVLAAAERQNFGFTLGDAGHYTCFGIDRSDLRRAGSPFHGFVRGVFGQDFGFQSEGGSCDDAAGRRGDLDFGDGNFLVVLRVVVAA